MFRNIFERIIATFISLVLFLPPASAYTQQRRPNILIIMSDDQRYDTMQYMPRTMSRIFDQGITFSRAYTTSPTCTPSRSSVLTGMYAYKHRALNNSTMLQEETLFSALQESGYRTGLVGKFLNAWDGSRRPEYDFLAAFPNTVQPYPYYNPTLSINGSEMAHTGYSTTILRDYAVQFLRESAQHNEPFALIYTPYAPHTPADPAPGDQNLYPNLPSTRPPSFNEADMSDKPTWLQQQPLLTDEQIKSIEHLRRKQLQSLNALDKSVDRIMGLLEEQGRLDDTIVMYLSDNGLFWGEHRGDRKQWVYEEASHIPFAIRYPRLVAQPRVEDRLVANIDIAPTLYELAGLPVPSKVDGQSLVPLLKGTNTWRDALMIETQTFYGHYYAVHTGRYVYCELDGDRSELYNLETDPYQLNNAIDEPGNAPIVAALKIRLHQIRSVSTAYLPLIARPYTR